MCTDIALPIQMNKEVKSLGIRLGKKKSFNSKSMLLTKQIRVSSHFCEWSFGVLTDPILLASALVLDYT